MLVKIIINFSTGKHVQRVMCPACAKHVALWARRIPGLEWRTGGRGYSGTCEFGLCTEGE